MCRKMAKAIRYCLEAFIPNECKALSWTFSNEHAEEFPLFSTNMNEEQCLQQYECTSSLDPDHPNSLAESMKVDPARKDSYEARIGVAMHDEQFEACVRFTASQLISKTFYQSL